MLAGGTVIGRASCRASAAGGALVILLLHAVPSHGQGRDLHVGRQDPAVVQKWKSELEQVDRLLVGGKYDKAYKESDRLLRTMTSRIVHGEGAFPLMAAAAILRAVAESGRGNAADAEWDLHLAKAFRAEVGKFDFTRYGMAGAPLAGVNPVRQRTNAKDRSKLGFEEPKPLRRVKPQYPDAMFAACVEGIVITSQILDRQGRLRNPLVLHSDGGPVMAYAALEALRKWRFQPAGVDGVPIGVYFNLTVNFRIKGCPRS